MSYNIKYILFGCQLYVFGGKNEEQEFNDLKVMKLINPSERQPGTFIFISFKVTLTPGSRGCNVHYTDNLKVFDRTNNILMI